MLQYNISKVVFNSQTLCITVICCFATMLSVTIHSAHLPAIPVLVLYYCSQQWAASCGGHMPFLAALVYVFF